MKNINLINGSTNSVSPDLPSEVNILLPETSKSDLPILENSTFPPHVLRPELQINPKFLKKLKHGCYLIHYTPQKNHSYFPSSNYYGTMRVEKKRTAIIASGDLYYHKCNCINSFPPNPAKGIPIFPRKNYRYYLSITKIILGFNGINLYFDRYKYNASNHSWNNEGEFHSFMISKVGMTGYSSSNSYFQGDVKNKRGQIVGQLSMGWISKYLRKATIEIDRVTDSESPDENGNGIDWRSVYKKVDWQVKISKSNNNIAPASGDSWSNAELHAAMVNWKDQANLDKEWRYHLLCVKELDATSRGIMYDAYAGDSNNIPREGAAISSHWMIPNTRKWGNVRGQRFGDSPQPYFRTAIHELGHAMGLYHNTNDNGYMNTTGTIASNGNGNFPANIKWNFNREDTKRLKHFPDPWVRPGMIPFGNSYLSFLDEEFEENYLDIEGLTLSVKPLLRLIPIGAPVRVELKLTNKSNQTIKTPNSLSLKSEYISGYVLDSFGKKRHFKSLFKCMDEHELKKLTKGKYLTHSLTLLRGADGALFPTSGTYEIKINVKWEENRIYHKASGQTRVFISQPVNEEHARVALNVINTPDTLLSLAIGGDHLTEGNQVIQEALKNKILRPHYELIESKQISKSFMSRKSNIRAAASKLNQHSILSIAEMRKINKIITTKLKGKSAEDFAQTLRKIAKNRGFSNETIELIFNA